MPATERARNFSSKFIRKLNMMTVGSKVLGMT